MPGTQIPPPEASVTDAEIREHFGWIDSRGRFGLAFLAALLAAAIGAGLWARLRSTLAGASGASPDVLAIGARLGVGLGIGVLVGMAVRFVGRGVTTKFSALAGLASLVAVLVGDVGAPALRGAGVVIPSPADLVGVHGGVLLGSALLALVVASRLGRRRLSRRALVARVLRHRR